MHTPGPWSAVCEDTINGMPAKFRVDAGGGCVALINTIGPADARLIAAAPALLEALVTLQTTRPRDNFGRVSYKTAYESMLRQTRAAIAAATI